MVKIEKCIKTKFGRNRFTCNEIIPSEIKNAIQGCNDMSQQAFGNMICHLFFKINDRDEWFLF